MPHEHWNDVPGDIAGETADNLPGGFGADNPDDDPDALYNDVTGHDVYRGNAERGFTPLDETPGSTAGTSFAQGIDTGSTVDPAHLLEGEEAHPGAGIGFTGGEMDKTVPSWVSTTEKIMPEPASGAGGASTEPETAQQARNFSTETEFAGGAEGAAGTIPAPDDTTS